MKYRKSKDLICRQCFEKAKIVKYRKFKKVTKNTAIHEDGTIHKWNTLDWMTPLVTQMIGDIAKVAKNP